MMDKRRVSSRLAGVLSHLGGPVGRFAVICVVFTVLWLPFRSWFDRGDPIAEIVAASGLQGTIAAVTAVAIGAMQKQRERRGAAPRLPLSALAPRRAPARRGAFVGAGVGLPFFGGLILLCLTTGRSWGYTVVFSVVLAVMAAAVAKSLRGAAAASTP
jgi:hypothetical protein